jgi:phosphatidylglycerophosphate synthase
MDFGAFIIIFFISISGLAMIIGPVMEMKGKIMFLEPKCPPRTTNRWGIGLMAFAAVMFILGLLLRNWLPSGIASPIVLGAYFLWFIGGIVAVYRNETLKLMVENPNDRDGVI